MKTSLPAGTVLFIFFWLVSFAIFAVLSLLVIGENTSLMIVAQQVLLFLVPALLYAFYAYNDFWDDLGLKKAGKISDYSWFIFLYLLAVPLVGFLYTFSETLPFPASWVEASKQSSAFIEEYIFGLLSDGKVRNLMLALFVMAVVPAICEEIFFRGVIQTNILKRTGQVHLAVWLSAIFFSAIHFEILGFFSRILLGAVLGYSFVLTKSLWVPIIIHFLNNAILVLLYFSYLNGLTEFNPMNPESSAPIWLIITCVIVGVLVFHFLLKRHKKGRIQYAPTDVNSKNAMHSNSE